MAFSPTLGRWMQQDPIGYADGMNPHLYEQGNPVSSLDPTGLLRIANAIATAKHYRHGLQKMAGIKPTDGQDFVTSEHRIEGQRREIDRALGPRAVLEGVKKALGDIGPLDWVRPREYDWNFAKITKQEYESIECLLFGQLKEEFSTHDDYTKNVYELGNGYGLAFYPMGGGSEYKTAVIRRGGVHYVDALNFETGEQVNADIAETYGGFSVVTRTLMQELEEVRKQIAALPGGQDMLGPRPRGGRSRPIPEVSGALIYVDQ